MAAESLYPLTNWIVRGESGVDAGFYHVLQGDEVFLWQDGHVDLTSTKTGEACISHSTVSYKGIKYCTISLESNILFSTVVHNWFKLRSLITFMFVFLRMESMATSSSVCT